MKNKILLLFAFVQISLFGLAQRIADDEAASIATQVLGKQVVKAEIIKPAMAPGKVAQPAEPFYSIFTGDDGKGFVIVSKDRRAPKVIGYGDGKIDANNLPPQLAAILCKEDSVLNANTTLPEHKSWAKTMFYAAGEGKVLETATWNQHEPYNRMTPTIDKQHAVTGCVATATAIVMKYYEWPDAPEGTGGYFLPGSDESVGYNFSGVTFDWDNTLMDYTWGTYSDTQANAVANIMFNAGASCFMSYGLTGSSAKPNLQYQGLLKNLKYNAEMTSKEIHSEDIISIITNEINADRPVLMTGNNGTIGHAYVCDGYDSEKLLHINWGWGGKSNGYFDLAEMVYNNNIELIYEITPKTSAESPHTGELINVGGLNYKLNYNYTCSVEKYNYGDNYSGAIVIPTQISYDGFSYAVTSIADDSFRDCIDLTSIEIPNSITKIGTCAFMNCGLTSVEIPSSVFLLGDGAFVDCKNLEEFSGKFASDDRRCLIAGGTLKSFAPKGLTTYAIPNSVTVISSYVFMNCTSLTSVVIPSTVTVIGWMSFCNCTSLTSVNIPNSVTNIRSWAFSDCKSLKTINIPNSVTQLGQLVFQDCSNLTSLEIPNSVTKFFAYPLLKGCTNLETLIGGYATDDNRCLVVNGDLIAFAPAGLTSYRIPDLVTVIQQMVFEDCINLASVEIPTSVTSIIASSFDRCNNLTEIKSLNTTPPDLSGSFNLSKTGCMIKVPSESVEAYKAAEGWKEFENIVAIQEEKPAVSPHAGETVNVGGLNYKLNEDYTCSVKKYDEGIKYSGDVVIPDEIEYDGIRYTVTSIGDGAFLDCASVMNISFPTTIKRIEHLAFYGCISLTSIDLPASIAYVGQESFENCSSLVSVNIYDTDKTISISNDAFSGCIKLSSFNVSDNCNTLSSADGVLFNKDKTTLIAYPKGKEQDEYLIPNTVIHIQSGFNYCYYLKSVKIPSSVTLIGGYISNCDGEFQINDNVFRYSPSIEAISVEEGNLKYSSINGVLFNKDKTRLCAFPEGLDMESYVIPNSVNTIGAYAFERTKLKSVEIPVSVVSVESDAFFNAINLTNIDLPNSVKTISAGAFGHCRNLQSVKLSNLLTSLSSDVFYGCLNLNSIIIPENISSLGMRTFYGCTSLKEIISLGITPASVSYHTFGNVSKTECIVKVPAESVEAYKAAEGWKEFENIVEIQEERPAVSPHAGKTVNVGGLNYKLNEDYSCSVERYDEGDKYSGDVVIPEEIEYDGIKYCVTKINRVAFGGCKDLISVSIPNTVTNIGMNAFEWCEELTSINIPNSVTTIDNHAFMGCEKMETVSLSNSLTTIGSSAFYGSGVTSITIPQSVITVNGGAFGNCTKLQEINVESGNGNYIATDGVLFDKQQARLIQFPAGRELNEYAIPNSVTIIEHHAFAGAHNLNKITIPVSVKTIEYNSFYWCNELAEIIIPNSVTSIGQQAFAYCGSLKSVKLSNALTMIDYNIFEGCSNLLSVGIPESITKINRAFNGCTLLTSIISLNVTPPTLMSDTFKDVSKSDCVIRVPASAVEAYKAAEGWKEFENIVAIQEERPAVSPHAGETVNVGGLNYKLNEDYSCSVERYDEGHPYSGDVVIPEEIEFDGLKYVVSSISIFAFSSCRDLTSIDIPNSVTSIPIAVFTGCSSLEAFTGKFASDDNRCLIVNGELLAFAAVGLTAYSIPDNVTRIKRYVFNNFDNLTSVQIPNSVEVIEDYAFKNCNNITSIEIPNSVTNILSGAFERCSGLTSFTGKFASEDQRCLVVDGRLAAFAPSGLSSYTIPSTVTIIGGYVFEGCKELVSIDIPASVESIERYNSFSQCSNLIELTCHNATPPSIFGDDDSFLDVSKSDCVIRVPASAVEAYKAADGWKEFEHIEAINLPQGDVTGDGEIDINDVVTIVAMILDGDASNPLGDLNGDGEVDVNDVVTLVGIILDK